MNISETMEGVGESPSFSPESIDQLLLCRWNTFLGFMNIEHNKGIMFVPFDLRTPKGQDVARLMFWRTLEEYAEAITASSLEHRLEELIDSFNYASAALCCDIVDTHTLMSQAVWETLKIRFDNSLNEREDPTRDRLGQLAYRLANVTETFRNRAWMENAQDTYFSGRTDYKAALFSVMGTLVRGFRDWDEFWRYFMAKDAVLQFRLRTNY